MAEPITGMSLEERRFPRLVRLVAWWQQYPLIVLTAVLVGIGGTFAADLLTDRYYIIAGFYLLPLSLSAVVLRRRPTMYLSVLCLALTIAVMARQGAMDVQRWLFVLFIAVSCGGLLLLAHLLSQVDRVSRRATARARYAEAVADIVGMTSERADEAAIVDYAVERISHEAGADSALLLLLRDNEWVAAASCGLPADAEGSRLPLEELAPGVEALHLDRAVAVEDALSDPGLPRAEVERLGLHALLVAPLRALGEDLGVILLNRARPGSRFTLDEVRFVESIAGYTAAAIENARLMDELDERQRDLSLVVESSLDFAASLELHEVLSVVIARLVAALDASTCEICSVDLERETLRSLASFEVEQPDTDAARGKVYDLRQYSSSRQALTTGTPLVVTTADDAVLSASERSNMLAHGYTGLLSLPLKARDRVIGLVEMFDRQPGRVYTQADIALAEAVCQFAGLAIDNAQLYAVERETAERNDRLISQLQRLMQIALRLNRLELRPDVQLILDEVVRAGADLLQTRRAAVVTTDAAGMRVRAEHESGHGSVAGGPAASVPLWIGAAISAAVAGGGAHVAGRAATPVDGYLVAPVDTAQLEGEAFLVFDGKRGGTFGTEEQLLATTLAIQLAASLANAQAYRREYEIAETLQSALQVEPPRLPGLDVGVRYVAATEAARVGGDFCDVVTLGPGRLMVAVGDVMGKGLAAAAQTALVRYMLRAYVAEGSPGESLSRLNSTIMTQEESLPFVTLLVAYIDVGRRVLEYAVAGHPRPVVLAGGRRVQMPSAGGYPVGMFHGAVFPTNRTVLPADATIVAYTDGLVEARRRGQLFGERRLHRVVRMQAWRAAQDLAETVMAAVQRYSGGVLADDAAVVVLRLP